MVKITVYSNLQHKYKKIYFNSFSLDKNQIINLHIAIAISNIPF